LGADLKATFEASKTSRQRAAKMTQRAAKMTQKGGEKNLG
jgi:hypothetical protein